MTGTTSISIKDRIQSTVEHILGIRLHNDALARMAANWQPTQLCPTCKKPMSISLVETTEYKVGDYFCNPCHELKVANRMAHHAEQIRQDQLDALFPETGSRTRYVHAEMQRILAGQLIPQASSSKQNTDALIAISPAMDVPQLDFPESPEPSIEIVRVSTPPFLSSSYSQYDFDVTREVTHKLDFDDEGDDTEKRPAIPRYAIPRDTVEIPAMTAEMFLLEVMRKPTHEQSTDENERIHSTTMLAEADWLR